MLLPVFMVLNKAYSPIAADGWGQLNGCLCSGRSCQHRCLGGWGSCTCCQVTFNPEQFCCMLCSTVKCFSQALGTDWQEKEIGFPCMTAARQYPPLKGYFHSWRECSACKMCWNAPRYSRLWRLAKWEWNVVIFGIHQMHGAHIGDRTLSPGIVWRLFQLFQDI